MTKKFKIELEKKLYEEYQEVLEASGNDRIEELADMLDIIKSLAKLEGKNLHNIITIADIKNKTGDLKAYEEKIFLEKVIEKDP